VRGVRRALHAVGPLVAVLLLLGACSGGDPAVVADTASSSTSAISTSLPATTVPTSVLTGVRTSADLVVGRNVVTYEVDGVEREAIVHVPSPGSDEPAPLVFVFHGHGGSGANAEGSFPVHELWPEAVVVYPTGLVGHKSELDPDGVKRGWQGVPGELEDRDVHFFDTMLADVTDQLEVDPAQVYGLGHSNGARFTSVLWNERGGVFAALAMSSAQAGGNMVGAEPVSVFMSMGRNDHVADFDVQVRSIGPAQQLLGVDPSAGKVDGDLTTYEGADGLELLTDIHDGGHEMPPGVLDEIVAFFQRHQRDG
jgi:polyhydroxybutyrate depolymerase